MRLLLTNDDGFEAEGLTTLARTVGAAHEVWVVAPESERSGTSNAITLWDSIRVRKVAERTYSCRGSPADCVLVALLGLVPPPVDLVLSGINHGPNLGTDILYSGTAGGARQATLMGRPGVALSVNSYFPPYDFACAAGFALRNLETFRDLADEDHFVNVNLPNTDCARAVPMITFPSRRIYREELQTFTAPNRDLFCFIGGPLPDARLEEGSDCDAVNRGFISITPVHVHPAYHDPIEVRYREAPFR